MTLQQEPLIYNLHPSNNTNFNLGMGAFGLDQFFQEEKPNAEMLGISDEASSIQSPPETCAPVRRRKRRRAKMFKNKEEMEKQRMTHIAVERNRRRQMNDYLAVLRSLMPPSYAQRGDQASIVGGAINFVKELEQLLHSLEAHKLTDGIEDQEKATDSNVFSNYFSFPQYSTRPSTVEAAERRSSVADIEVTMVETHANINILSKRRPKQLLKMVAGFQSIHLNILHLNVTTLDQSVLYSFSVKVEEECQLITVNEIATAVHEMLGMIQPEESTYLAQTARHTNI